VITEQSLEKKGKKGGLSRRDTRKLKKGKVSNAKLRVYPRLRTRAREAIWSGSGSNEEKGMETPQ